MVNSEKEIFHIVILVSVFFLLLVSIIIITALLYHTRKRIHKIEVSNFQNILLQSQLEIQEQTMQTIGADLHDNIGQLLSLTSLTLSSVELDNLDKAQQKIDTARDLTLQSIKEMRLLGKLLQGEQLIGMGLAEAISHEISWVEKSGKYQVNYTIEGEKPAADNSDKDLILFRIQQEILNNIIKHSQATHIDIKLTYKVGTIELQITDNGTGFNIYELPETDKGMGLRNIQKRAEIVGGEVFIQSQPGEGTCIDIVIPYP